MTRRNHLQENTDFTLNSQNLDQKQCLEKGKEKLCFNPVSEQVKSSLHTWVLHDCQVFQQVQLDQFLPYLEKKEHILSPFITNFFIQGVTVMNPIGSWYGQGNCCFPMDTVS